MRECVSSTVICFWMSALVLDTTQDCMCLNMSLNVNAFIAAPLASNVCAFIAYSLSCNVDAFIAALFDLAFLASNVDALIEMVSVMLTHLLRSIMLTHLLRPSWLV